MVDVPKQPITLFYSYATSHRDEVLREELEKHLAGLQHRGLIKSWSRREIIAGKSQREEIDKHLEAASVILLLISPDFLASDYAYSAEMLRAMERHQAGDARVIPILLRPVDIEDEPFTHLALLPTNGKPISVWRNRDSAFAEIAKEIGRSIKELQRSSSSSSHSASQNPFRLASDVLYYFTHLTTFLDTEGSWFQEDYGRGNIYSPEKEYFATIEKVLNTRQRVLLVGRAAAGKTVLAIAFAKHMQERAGYQVGYKDVKHAAIGDGRKWYALAREHDRPGILYILDNCHLMPREVDEFCRQWKEQAPNYAQCLLISRTNHHETHDGSYLQMFTDDEKVQVRSEDIFLQVIEQYVSTLPGKTYEYETMLNNDDAQTLEKQHAHNLVISRSRLDVWKALGPQHRLSEVRQEDLYRALEAKYLSVYGSALTTLCILQRYEVRAHIAFVEKKLPQDEIKQLQKEKLLIHSTVNGYGQLYDLVLHPTEAREFFLAHVFKQYGAINQENINILVTSVLEAYLMTKPANYITVYDSLARQRHEDILRRLLTDRDLQESTAQQFGKENVVDAITYVFKVAKLDSNRGIYLMNRVVRVSGVTGICTKLLKISFQDTAVLLQSIKYIDAELAHSVVDELSIQQFAQQVVEEDIQSLFRLLRTVRDIVPSQALLLLASIPVEALVAKTTVRNIQDTVKQLQVYGYTDTQLQHFVASLDMQKLAQQCERISLQSLFWTFHTLEKISVSQTRALLSLLPIWMLATKASVSNLGSIDQIVQLMQRFEYTREQMAEFVEALDIEQIAQRARQGNLRRLASLLRTLKSISSTSVTNLLEILNPADIAQLCHIQETSLEDLEQLRKASTKGFWEAFLRDCSPEDIATIFRSVPLGRVGTFLLYQYMFHTVQEGYAHFQERFLREQLTTESLNELGEFLDRIAGIRQVGQQLARNALDLFMTTDIAERIAHTELRQFALLLHHVRSINVVHLSALLAPLRQPAILRNALTTSDIQGIQLFIFNIANIDTSYLPVIREGLLSSNLSEKLEYTPLKDAGLFLWNTYRYIDEDIARIYCEYMDTRLKTQQVNEASPEHLCFFLWNLTSISASKEVQVFKNAHIHQLLVEGWSNEIGWRMVLLGIAAMAYVASDNIRTQSLLVQETALGRWFTVNGHNPYFLALALQGLRRYDERVTHTIIPKVLPVEDALHKLKSARPSAITPRSIQLIEDTTQWLERLREEEK